MRISYTLPKMILFDYGHTLLYEPGWDSLRGNKALFKYIKSNKIGFTAQQVNDFSDKLFQEIGIVRELGFELPNQSFQKLLYEYLEIELSISLAEVEKVFWDNASYGAVMPCADTMLDYLNKHSIRSGVISNISFSGSALTDRINRLLPNNKFEFIITSSEYMHRKPNSLLFDLALKKAGLHASEVWFCGDNVTADVEGSAKIGIFPVWFDHVNVEEPQLSKPTVAPMCECLHIHEWDELITILKDMEISDIYRGER